MGVHAGKLGGNSNQRQEPVAEVQPLQYAYQGTAFLNGAAQAHKQTDGAHAGRKTVLSTPRCELEPRSGWGLSSGRTVTGVNLRSYRDGASGDMGGGLVLSSEGRYARG